MRELSALQAWHSPSDWQRLLRIENTVGIGVFSVVECTAAGRIQPYSLCGDSGRRHGAHAPRPFTPATLAARKVGQFVIVPFKSVLRERVV
jgi:hypothetical protein